MNGPYETEREARDSAAAEAVREIPAGAAFSDQREAAKAQMILDACTKARVAVGAYDERIVRWLAGWGTEACAVVAGLIERAAATGGDHGDCL